MDLNPTYTQQVKYLQFQIINYTFIRLFALSHKVYVAYGYPIQQYTAHPKMGHMKILGLPLSLSGVKGKRGGQSQMHLYC